MPSLNTVRRYQALDPYNHVIDNGPINDLDANVIQVNAAVDAQAQVLAASQGTQSSLTVRIGQSLNADGTLKVGAVNATNHGIAAHADGAGFVRMTDAERAKLAGLATAATDLGVRFELTGSPTTYSSGLVNVRNSDSVHWRTDGQGVYADVTFPLTARHRHYYDITPQHANSATPNRQNYYTTSVHTPYVAGSLRVYVNGSRIRHTANAGAGGKFPRHGGSVTWVAMSYAEDTAITNGVVTTGAFSLAAPLQSADEISIDFDIILS